MKNEQNQKNADLENYLETQMKNVMQWKYDHHKPIEESPFDQIQQKLKRLEHKLIHLRNQSPTDFKRDIPKHSQKSNQFSQKQNQVEIEQQQTSKNNHKPNYRPMKDKFQSQNKKQWKKVSIEDTPIQNKLKQKAKSQAIFSQNHQYIPSKNIKTTHKKDKIIKNNSLFDDHKFKNIKIKENNRKSSDKKMNQKSLLQSSKKINQSYNNLEYSNNLHKKHFFKESQSKIRLLEKEVDHCWKHNSQLKKKISYLQDYEAQYWKMKELFEKCEKLRKRRKIRALQI